MTSEPIDIAEDRAEKCFEIANNILRDLSHPTLGVDNEMLLGVATAFAARVIAATYYHGDNPTNHPADVFAIGLRHTYDAAMAGQREELDENDH